MVDEAGTVPESSTKLQFKTCVRREGAEKNKGSGGNEQDGK